MFFLKIFHGEAAAEIPFFSPLIVEFCNRYYHSPPINQHTICMMRIDKNPNTPDDKVRHCVTIHNEDTPSAQQNKLSTWSVRHSRMIYNIGPAPRVRGNYSVLASSHRCATRLR